MKTIEVPCFRIRIQIFEGSSSLLDGPCTSTGIISSNLHAKDKRPWMNSLEAQEAAIDGLERLVLAHACQGIDVCSKAYVTGIINAVDAIIHQLKVEEPEYPLPSQGQMANS